MWCRNSTSMSLRAAPATPHGRVRSGAWYLHSRTTRKRCRISSARCVARSGLVETMTANDSFPLGHPAFVSNILDRAAHLRGNDEKLLVLESHRDARAYVVHRDSLVVKREASGLRALLTIDEALQFGAN